MKEKNKRIQKWLLRISIIFCISVFMSPVDVNAMEQKEVAAKLESVIDKFDGKTWYGRGICDGRMNSRSMNGSRSGTFAQFVFDEIFRRGNAVLGNTVDYAGNLSGRLKDVAEDVVTLGTLAPGYSCAELESLLKEAAPGDYIRVRKYTGGRLHSMIVVGVNSEKRSMDILDADSDGRGTVRYYTQTFLEFKARNAGVTVYRYSGNVMNQVVFGEQRSEGGHTIFGNLQRNLINVRRRALQTGGAVCGFVSVAVCLLHSKKNAADEDPEEGE